MKLFHGSTLRIDAPRVDAGRRHLDFGPGFYLTILDCYLSFIEAIELP